MSTERMEFRPIETAPARRIWPFAVLGAVVVGLLVWIGHRSAVNAETKPVALAGVMGGQNSEIHLDTTEVLIESAYFKPASVRRTSKRLDLKTEASARFERGADVNGTLPAMQRAIALMEFIGAGKVSGHVVDRYPSPRQPLKLHLRRSRLASLLGVPVPDAEVVRILRGLGLGQRWWLYCLDRRRQQRDGVWSQMVGPVRMQRDGLCTMRDQFPLFLP